MLVNRTSKTYRLARKVGVRLLELIQDPGANGKLSASRLILIFWTWKYASWVERGIITDPDSTVLLALLFGASIAVAFKTSPAEMARALFSRTNSWFRRR